MPTLFDVLGYPGKSAYSHDTTNLSNDQVVALHQARSLCQLLMETCNPIADVPMSHSISFDALEGALWLLRDLLDTAGKPAEGESHE